VDTPKCENDYVTSKEDSTVTCNVITNDSLPGDVVLSIIQNPTHGTATTDGDSLITYTPDQGFAYLDTISYKICLKDNTSLCDSAIMVVYSQSASGITKPPDKIISIYPNPGNGSLTINTSSPLHLIRVFSLSGSLLRLYRTKSRGTVSHINMNHLHGIFLLEVSTEKGIIRKKVVIR